MSVKHIIDSVLDEWRKTKGLNIQYAPHPDVNYEIPVIVTGKMLISILHDKNLFQQLKEEVDKKKSIYGLNKGQENY